MIFYSKLGRPRPGSMWVKLSAKSKQCRREYDTPQESFPFRTLSNHSPYICCIQCGALAKCIFYQIRYHRRVLATRVGYRFNRDFLRYYQFDVGAYTETSNGAIITHDTFDRTHSCIYLRPPGNRQGLNNCFSLDTGHVMVQRWQRRCRGLTGF